MPPSTLPPHRSRPNQRFRPGRQAAAVVQPADVLHNTTPTTPRTTRRTTRNTQPGHEPKNLLVSEEEDGGLSGTGLPPRTEAGLRARCRGPRRSRPSPSHRSGPNRRLGPGRWAVVVVQSAGVLHGATPTTPRTTRRTTRNTQPNHHLKNLLVSEEEDGGDSSTARPSEGEGHQTLSP